MGLIRIEYRGANITRLKKTTDDTQDRGSSTPLTDEVNRQLKEYFDGKRKEFDFPYEMNGTAFQKSVWEALCAIPYGETRSYNVLWPTRRTAWTPGRGPRGGCGKWCQSCQYCRALPSRDWRKRKNGGLCQRAGYERGAAETGSGK